MKFYQYCFLLLTLLSCEKKDTKEVDYEFQTNFQNCIQIILLRNQGCDIDFESISKAYTCLETITEIKSLVSSGNDQPYFYDKDELLKDDLDKWSSWFAINSKNYTMQKSNEVFEKINKKIKSIPKDLIGERNRILNENSEKLNRFDHLKWPDLILSKVKCSSD